MKIVVTGAGMMGLCTAMLLAKEGHEVTVVERDAASPPDPRLAWETWERRGVNQFRLAHLYLSRFRAIAEAELPELVADLDAAGACRYNIVANIPDEMKGGPQPDDGSFELLSGRRSFVEAVAARTCEASGVSVRRGTAVEGLVAGPPALTGVPNVTGVRLAGGGKIDADLVVDATGRRSPLPGWLDELGAPPCVEELDDSGFVYYGRHFRSPDGSLPLMLGSLKQDYGSVSCLTLPADNGTWSVTLIASARDSALRSLRHTEAWTAAVGTMPLAAHWLDGEPIDDGVAVMAKIEDRIRDYAPEGMPVATGVLALADSWACTNPSLGRGVSIGAIHAIALRDLLRNDGCDDPDWLARAWSEATAETVEAWYRETVMYDRHRLNEIHALIDGFEYQTDDEDWRLIRGLEKSLTLDADLLRSFLTTAMVLRRPSELFADDRLKQRVLDLTAQSADEPPFGPTRAEILAVAG